MTQFKKYFSPILLSTTFEAVNLWPLKLKGGLVLVWQNLFRRLEISCLVDWPRTASYPND